jgi:hypothetical protein
MFQIQPNNADLLREKKNPTSFTPMRRAAVTTLKMTTPSTIDTKVVCYIKTDIISGNETEMEEETNAPHQNTEQPSHSLHSPSPSHSFSQPNWPMNPNWG